MKEMNGIGTIQKSQRDSMSRAPVEHGPPPGLWFSFPSPTGDLRHRLLTFRGSATFLALS